MIKVSAPGNVFFFGEHSVVYERPALLAAIDMRTCSFIEKRKDSTVVIESGGYGKVQNSLEELKKKRYESHTDYKILMDPLRDLAGILIRKFNINSGFELKISSDIPKESGGMSSSTAVLSSILKAVSEAFQLGIKPEEFFHILYPLQVRIHGGAASGSEITSSSMGGYNWFRIDKNGEKAKFDFRNLGRQSYHLVIGDSGVGAATGDTVPYVRRGWEKDKQSYEEVFDKIAEVVKQGEKALLNGKAEEAGRLMEQNQELLKVIGVSHPKLEKMIEAARKAGAFGAKLSGGGKGGIMIALCPEERKQQVEGAIEKAGGKTIKTEVGVEGARVEG